MTALLGNGLIVHEKLELTVAQSLIFVQKYVLNALY